jgi:hypothetical protein
VTVDKKVKALLANDEIPAGFSVVGLLDYLEKGQRGHYRGMLKSECGRKFGLLESTQKSRLTFVSADRLVNRCLQ